ncbi:MAG: hypothetical protein C5B51_11835 [Terriglobia bacterium]|nr:MAG: hypothetical protein C5B51_11835 [Terriglobia bacterium]
MPCHLTSTANRKINSFFVINFFEQKAVMSGERGLAAPKSVYSVCELDAGNHRELFAEHLKQILVSPAFRNSKRYAAVLRYVVERALEGNPDRLKERTIGVDVFGRPADYDTSSDHAVRSAMAEVRKRLAQYYQEDANSDLRIEIQPGSYIPQFRLADSATALEVTHADGIDSRPAALAVRGRWNRVFIAAVAAAFLALAAIGLALTRAEDPVAAFWRPVFSSPSPILLCIGNLEGGRSKQPPAAPEPPAEPLTMRAFHVLPSQTVHIADATTLARFAGFLQSHRKAYRIASQTEADFRDLQNGPAILIGLLNNEWTGRLVGKLRFWVERPAPGKVVIRDSQQPLRADWSMDYLTPVAEVTRDYALVVRALDPKTDQMVVMVGGISVFGTLAAGEFLTSERDMQQLSAQVPRGWQQRNLELVLSTEVIRGKSGRARIVATHLW